MSLFRTAGSETRFKEWFVANFLSTWCANKMDEYCLFGQQKALNHPPVEDAEFLADEAWKDWKIYLASAEPFRAPR